MTTLNECERRQVLASLVPVKARNCTDVSLTDYEVPSVLQRQGNQTRDDLANVLSVEDCGVAAVKTQFFDHAQSSQTAIVKDTELQQVQQRWLDHQQDNFDMLLHNRQVTDSQRQSFTPDCQSAKYETTLRQLDHVQQLLLTAQESLAVTLDAPDYMVATQCYTMALEQLTAMARALERRGARKK